MKFQLQSSGYGMFPESFQSKFRPTIAFESDNGAGSTGGAGTGGDAGTSDPASSGGDDDLTGLKTALGSERKRAGDFERQLKQLQLAYEGISPEVAKQAQERLKTLQTQQEEWNQRETTLTNTLTEEFNRKVANEKTTAQKWQSQYHDLKALTLADVAYQSAGGRSGGSDDGITYFQAFFTNVKGSMRLNAKEELEIVDGNGARLFSKKDPNVPMSAAEFFSGYAAHPVFSHYFQAQNNSKGGGMNPNSGGYRNGQTRTIDRNNIASFSEPGVIEALAKGDNSVIVR